MKINLKEELAAGASAYEEMLKKDPRLRMELEAKDRLYSGNEDRKRNEKHKKEERKKALKKKMRSRSRRPV